MMQTQIDWCFYGIMLTDAQVYCMTSMIYFDHYLPLKPSLKENGGNKVVHLIYIYKIDKKRKQTVEKRYKKIYKVKTYCS